MTTIKTVPMHLTLVRAAGDEGECIITTPTEDLMGDEVMPGGLDTARYMSSPRAVLFAHDMGRLPVAQTISLAKSLGGVRAKFRWLDHPDAAAVRRVYEAGALGASIGFLINESEPTGRGRGMRFTKTTLTEWSLVPVPANPQCVALVKSLGGRGAPRGGDDFGGVTREEIAAAVREVVTVEARRRTTEAVERERPLTMAEQMFDWDAAFGPAPARDELVPGVSAADVGAALRETLPEMVTAAVGRAVRQAQGKLD